jgi:cytosine/adenosine deaminase-related metal-dependent hydrolase
MFDEMRQLAATDQTVSPVDILRMATINGARALGLAGEAGELCRNAGADLIAIPFDGKLGDVHEAVIAHTGNVSASMIDGRWAMPPIS